MSDSARALHGAVAPPAADGVEPSAGEDRRPGTGGAPSRPPLGIRVRRARSEDRAAVMSFASRTWDGWDYIPRAWKGWLKASDGVVLVALPAVPSGDRAGDVDEAGQPLDPSVPIAMARVVMLSATEAWLEGIRVDPRVRGRSVATHLQVAELSWAAAHRSTIVRYITGVDNEASHRLGARHGFRLAGAWRNYLDERPHSEAPYKDDDEGDRVRDAAQAARGRLLDDLAGVGLVVEPVASAREIDVLWSVVTDDPTFRLGGGLYEVRPWSLQSLTRERFEAHVRRAEVVADRVGRAAGAGAVGIVVRHADSSEDPRAHFSMLAGDRDAALRLATTVRVRAGEPVRLRLPDPTPPLTTGREDAWREAGFPARGHTNHLLERPIADGPPLPEPSGGGYVAYEEPPRAVAGPAEP